jgi:NADPH-dependent curcumin reductase
MLRTGRFKDFMRDMENCVASGHMTYNEQILEGLENCVAGLEDVFEGKNFGKYIFKVRLME